MINHDNITLGHPKNIYLGSSGPLEASRGQIKQTLVGIEVVYGILEQVGSVQHAQKQSVTMISLWGHPENTHLGSFGPLQAIGGRTKQTMVGLEVVYGILKQVGSVQQAQK